MSLVDYQSSDDDMKEEIPVEKKPPSVIESSKRAFTLPKKPRETVKITVPSLSEYKDDEEEEVQSKKPKIAVRSGLFSILPPPKYSGTKAKNALVPHILTKKKELPSGSLKLSMAGATSKAESSAKSLTNEYLVCDPNKNSGNEETSEPVNDFFSLESTSHRSTENTFDLFGTGVKKTSTTMPQFVPSYNFAVGDNQLDVSNSNENIDYLPLVSNNDFATSSAEQESTLQIEDNSFVQTDEQQRMLTDEGFLRLQGKRVRGFEDVNIIDVSLDDQLPSKTTWHTKSLTEEKKKMPSRKKHDMPTQQQKRKHQITYLAFQAKERELDLKNQWAQNRLTKRETQSKYGF